MAAIRSAGGKKGAKLKSGKERKKERKQEKASGGGGGGGGGDIMSDLFAKISMRRKGISGSSKPDGGGRDEKSSNRNNDTDSMSPMDKISAMIPPPSKGKDRSDTHDSEDWGDED